MQPRLVLQGLAHEEMEMKQARLVLHDEQEKNHTMRSSMTEKIWIALWDPWVRVACVWHLLLLQALPRHASDFSAMGSCRRVQ